ncbi:hypothetical protein Bca4012_056867 [Brassica carinata]
MKLQKLPQGGHSGSTLSANSKQRQIPRGTLLCFHLFSLLLEINWISISQKDLRQRTLTSKKISTSNNPKPYRSFTSRCKTGSFFAKLEMSASGFSLKCSERAEKRK